MPKLKLESVMVSAPGPEMVPESVSVVPLTSTLPAAMTKKSLVKVRSERPLVWNVPAPIVTWPVPIELVLVTCSVPPVITVPSA